MITWKSYSPDEGEQIDFCCDSMKSIYGNLLTWDPAEKKWCFLVKRKTIQHNPYTQKNEIIIEKDKEDLKIIDYCPFCGANVYGKVFVGTLGEGWGGMKTQICGDAWVGAWIQPCFRCDHHPCICEGSPWVSKITS